MYNERKIVSTRAHAHAHATIYYATYTARRTSGNSQTTIHLVGCDFIVSDYISIFRTTSFYEWT